MKKSEKPEQKNFDAADWTERTLGNCQSNQREPLPLPAPGDKSWRLMSSSRVVMGSGGSGEGRGEGREEGGEEKRRRGWERKGKGGKGGKGGEGEEFGEGK